MGRFFNDLTLPDDIIYYMLMELDQSQDKIIFTPHAVQKKLKKEGYLVSAHWATWRLKKSLNIVPNGWVAEKWNSCNNGIRVKFIRIKKE